MKFGHNAIRAFSSWRMAAVLLTGFSSGLPLMLATGKTLQTWMASEKVDLATIGFFSLASLPLALKFLWSPLMDRFAPPFFGRRRGWILVAQVMLTVLIATMAVINPVTQTWWMAVLALSISFFGATQDIAIDAYRTELLQPEELGPGAGVYVTGYRIAMLVSGSGAIILADHLPWQSVYQIMAGAMLLGTVVTMLAPEPQTHAQPPRTLGEAVVEPARELLSRRGILEILLFVLLYKIDVSMAQAMTSPFLLAIGFSKSAIGVADTGFGTGATIIGCAIGGAWMMRLGMFRGLLVFGLLQGLSGMTYTLLAAVGHNYGLMVAAVIVENVCAGMGIAAYTALIMSLCNRRFTISQYALFTGVMALSRTTAGTMSGYLAKHVGWVWFFTIATVISAPGLLLLVRFNKWQMPQLVSADESKK